jgi:hypothetical protein
VVENIFDVVEEVGVGGWGIGAVVHGIRAIVRYRLSILGVYY